jgi:(p)ppGpp synthase/HD superfamily hydrolase
MPGFFGPRFQEALHFVIDIHGGDFRKGTQIPYVAHLLSVCSLVLVDGGDEEEAIAALLHDSLEDHPEMVSRADIGERFGPRVLALVERCTDTPPEYQGGPKPPFRARKAAYIEHIRQGEPEETRVALADKLDNARAILTDYRKLGDKLWSRFHAGETDQLWYYRSLVSAFRQAGVNGHMLEELDGVVCEIERECKARRK